MQQKPYLLLLSTLLCFLTIFGSGYQGTCLNLPRPVVEAFVNASFYSHYGSYLTTVQSSSLWGFLISVPILPEIFTSLACSFILDRYGRKQPIVFLHAFIAGCSSMLMLLARVGGSFEMFLAGRLLFGVASGLAMGPVPLYLTECSPPRLRGTLAGLATLAMGMGGVTGNLMGLPFILGSETTWPLLVGLTVIPATILMAIGQCCYPASPKHLYIKGCHDEEKATKVILQMYGRDCEVKDVLRSFREEERMAESTARLRQILHVSHLRKVLLISIVANLAMCTTGAGSIASYSATILRTLDLDEDQIYWAVVGNSLIRLISMTTLLIQIDKLGRRPLLLWSLIACIIILTAFVTLALYEHFTKPQSWLGYVSICLIFAHSIANPGPIMVGLMIGAELSPHNVRALIQSIAMSCNGIATLAIEWLYPMLNALIGHYSIVALHIIPTIACCIYLWISMPESKGKTTEQIVTEIIGDVKV